MEATERSCSYFERMLERRSRGEPLQYVLGHWGFRKLDLLVDGRVLIPRPETEQVVEAALGELARVGGVPGDGVVVDLGTGSGAIALSIAVEVPRCQVWGTERSAGALAVARANLAGVGGFAATRVRLLEGRWFDPLPSELRGAVTVVVSNPPYVAESELASLPEVVTRWEPREALIAGPTGLEDLTRILEEAPEWLSRPGSVVLELAPHQAADVKALASGSGRYDSVEIRADLAGRDRVLVARVA